MPTELDDLFKSAASIAKNVPESMQATAFNRALDLLLARAGVSVPPTLPVAGAPSPTASRGTATTKNGATGKRDVVGTLLAGIDRTKHPEIVAAQRVLERALYLLKIAQDQFGIDGMTAPEIAEVLTEKFRLKTSRQAVAQALSPAVKMVDSVPGPGAAKYRLMQGGEDHLVALANGSADVGRPPVLTGARKRSRKRTKKATAEPGDGKADAPGKGSARAASKGGRVSSRPGPMQALSDLVSKNFFKTGQTIGSVREHLEVATGRNYKPGDLSPALVRLLRAGTLVRKKNSDGQFDYQVP